MSRILRFNAVRGFHAPDEAHDRFIQSCVPSINLRGKRMLDLIDYARSIRVPVHVVVHNSEWSYHYASVQGITAKDYAE